MRTISTTRPGTDRPWAGVRGRAAAIVITIAAALSLAACGSAGSPTSSTQSSETASSAAPATETATTQAATTPSATTQSAQAAPVTPAQAAVATPGCRHVGTPASRAGEQAAEPSGQLDPTRTYTVTLTTNCGPIVIELAVREAPKIANAFADLVKIGYYDNLTFHRIVPGFVIQGGDPNGNGSGGPSWQVVEAPPSNLRYAQGVVAMAKSSSAPSGAAGSQFFIVVGSSVNLPPIYALVGRVISGQPNAEAIARVPTESSEMPRVPIVIEKATLSVH